MNDHVLLIFLILASQKVVENLFWCQNTCFYGLEVSLHTLTSSDISFYLSVASNSIDNDHIMTARGGWIR